MMESAQVVVRHGELPPTPKRLFSQKGFTSKSANNPNLNKLEVVENRQQQQEPQATEPQDGHASHAHGHAINGHAHAASNHESTLQHQTPTKDQTRRAWTSYTLN